MVSFFETLYIKMSLLWHPGKKLISPFTVRGTKAYSSLIVTSKISKIKSRSSLNISDFLPLITAGGDRSKSAWKRNWFELFTLDYNHCLLQGYWVQLLFWITNFPFYLGVLPAKLTPYLEGIVWSSEGHCKWWLFLCCFRSFV